AVAGCPCAMLVVEVTPTPDNATVSGPPGALVVMVSVPAWPPPLAGANFTLTVQDPPAAIEEPQVLDWLNGPLTPTEETETAPLPGFATVTVCAVLVDPDATSPNARLDGEAVSAPGCAGLGNAVSTGVMLQPELPLPRLKVYAPAVLDG